MGASKHPSFSELMGFILQHISKNHLTNASSTLPTNNKQTESFATRNTEKNQSIDLNNSTSSSVSNTQGFIDPTSKNTKNTLYVDTTNEQTTELSKHDCTANTTTNTQKEYNIHLESALTKPKLSRTLKSTAVHNTFNQINSYENETDLRTMFFSELISFRPDTSMHIKPSQDEFDSWRLVLTDCIDGKDNFHTTTLKSRHISFLLIKSTMDILPLQNDNKAEALHVLEKSIIKFTESITENLLPYFCSHNDSIVGPLKNVFSTNSELSTLFEGLKLNLPFDELQISFSYTVAPYALKQFNILLDKRLKSATTTKLSSQKITPHLPAKGSGNAITNDFSLVENTPETPVKSLTSISKMRDVTSSGSISTLTKEVKNSDNFNILSENKHSNGNIHFVEPQGLVHQNSLKMNSVASMKQTVSPKTIFINQTPTDLKDPTQKSSEVPIAYRSKEVRTMGVSPTHLLTRKNTKGQAVFKINSTLNDSGTKKSVSMLNNTAQENKKLQTEKTNIFTTAKTFMNTPETGKNLSERYAPSYVSDSVNEPSKLSGFSVGKSAVVNKSLTLQNKSLPSLNAVKNDSLEKEFPSLKKGVNESENKEMMMSDHESLSQNQRIDSNYNSIGSMDKSAGNQVPEEIPVVSSTHSNTNCNDDNISKVKEPHQVSGTVTVDQSSNLDKLHSTLNIRSQSQVSSLSISTSSLASTSSKPTLTPSSLKNPTKPSILTTSIQQNVNSRSMSPLTEEKEFSSIMFLKQMNKFRDGKEINDDSSDEDLNESNFRAFHEIRSRF